MKFLTPEQLECLSALDSPTVANAIEHFKLRDVTDGYMSMEVPCLTPELSPMVGYAVTVTADSTSPGAARPNAIQQLYNAVAASPKPVIVIIKDVGLNVARSCHAGDNLCTLFQASGAVGLITDGGIRDLAGIRANAPGFHVFARGLVVSHGNSYFLELGATVSIGGLVIKPGDLLHADQNGVVSLPIDVVDGVIERAKAIIEKERHIISWAKSKDFDPARVVETLSH